MALRLFEPYWKTIAVLVVQNLNKRPQIAQLLGDLLGMGIPGVLKLTQLYTIPYLVLTKRRDVLQRIADAHGPGTTTADLCVQQPEQMPAILSILILHAMPDSEDIIMTLLHDAFPDLVDDSLGDILKSDPVHIVCELLKVAGEDDKTRKVRAREGINFLASRIHRRSSHAKDSLKIHIGLLFVTFALGIIQTLSDVIAQVNVPRSISERRRCIRAVEQMALIAEGHLSNALPQVRRSHSPYWAGTHSSRFHHAYDQRLKILLFAMKRFPRG